MFSRLNITTKGLILVLVPVILEISFASYLAMMLSDTFSKIVRVEHSIDAITNMTEQKNMLLSTLCVALDVSEPDLQKRVTAIDSLDAQTTPVVMEEDRVFPELVEFNDDLEDFHRHVHAIIKKFREKVISSHGQSYRTGISDEELLPVFMELKGLTDNAFYKEKQLGELQPHEMARFQSEFYSWLVVGLVSSCLICFLLSRGFSMDLVRRLNNVTENLKRISFNQPLKEAQEGADEIAELDGVVFDAGQELQEARKRESAILDNATDVLCSIDSNLRFRDVGKAATRNWGFELDELSGRSLLSVLTDDTIDSTRENFEAIAAERKDGHIENVVKCRDGTTRVFLWTVNWNSTAQMFYCVAHDVSQLRAMEKLKQDFLAMVSHDLRTPLNSVAIGLSMLAENRLGELPEPVQRQLAKSRNNMDRLSHLVHDLLELEKLGAGKMFLNREVASAAEICGYAKEPLEGLAEKSRVRLIGPSGDAAVLVDVKRLTQALINLLSNAIKFSPKDSSVVLDVKTVGDLVEIGISDNGPGIPAEHQTLIFNRFQQAGAAPGQAVKSTGLGLAIVEAIIKEHGGSVGVESVAGKGSRFWVRVPRLIDDEEAP